MKTIHEMLVKGFKGRSLVYQALHLGETNILITEQQQKLLQGAIENKDYYEIKSIIQDFKHKSLI